MKFFNLLLLLSTTAVVITGQQYSAFTSEEISLIQEKLSLSQGVTLQHQIGFGAFGSVYAGLHRDGSSIAVKLSRSPGKHDTNWLNLAKQEVTCLKSTSHAHLIRHHQSSFINVGVDVLIITTELLGPSLAQLLNRTDTLDGLPPFVVYRIALHASEALSYLHAKFIVHNDVKLENILMDRELGSGSNLMEQLPGANFKLIDLSLCELYQSRSTLAAYSVGTSRYYSPEKARLTAPYDPFQADAYALGYTLVRCLMGQRNLVFLQMKLGKEAGIDSQKVPLDVIFKAYRSSLPEDLQKEPFYKLVASLIEPNPVHRIKVEDFNRELKPRVQSTKKSFSTWAILFNIFIVTYLYFKFCY